ncbi:translocon at the outer envelope membrane of chloroplasts 159 [Rhynchospora pubera]|uniref:Translocon at the outer envelope membrane of chloroplasts 159 n=1 Tax=Rhynchospora pubera TaxID=906938 RepID=A0AAV8FF56_9POAL|nr:translocon at the outer envelope membrane of chloroplasts 159 [Rhynchospora pubera]
MMSFRKWFPSQVGPTSLLSARPFNFFDDSNANEDDSDEGTEDDLNTELEAPISTGHTCESQATETPTDAQASLAASSPSPQNASETNKSDPSKRLEALQINFLRIINRIGESTNNPTVTQVLYRLHVASLIRAGESGTNRPILDVNKAQGIAVEQECTRRSSLDFSLRILLMGRTGTGKSATINSIFNQPKAGTDPFRPCTNRIQEISGTVKGVKVTFIDTPGLSPSCINQRRNRKILHSIKKFIKKAPPDIVLFFERLDTSATGDHTDYPLIKLITEIFSPSIWFNTVLVMTHASSVPEGPDGIPINFESFVRYRASLVQQQIHRALVSTQTENPVIVMENNIVCEANTKWRNLTQFLLLCAGTKVLGDAYRILKLKNDCNLLTTANPRVPSLPHLLSSLLKPQSVANSSEIDGEIDSILEDGEDYDELPPIRILTKKQFAKLSDEQKEAYLDELDYRETLYLKKQLREDLKRRKESRGEATSEETENPPSYVMQVSDMPIPQSFDPGHPEFRYRCLLGTNDWWLFRPVLDPQGWDHDLGFDGVNLEASREVGNNVNASFLAQFSKDKSDFTIQSECTGRYTDLEGGYTISTGTEIQTTGQRDLVYKVHGDAAFKTLSWNKAGGGFSIIKFGNMYFIGAKLEDSVNIGKRFQVVLNSGRLWGNRQVAHGGTIEAVIKGRDYPVRDEKISFGATILSFENESVLGGSLQADLRVGRGSKVSFGMNLNNRMLGQVSVRTSTSNHTEIAFIAAMTLIRALFRRKPSDNME